MTSAEVQEYLKRKDAFDLSFANVSKENQLSEVRDLCALLLVKKLNPNAFRVILDASHDMIYVNLEPENIPDEKTLHDLYRCGVKYDSYTGNFYMFV